MPTIGDLFADVLIDAGIEFVFGMPAAAPRPSGTGWWTRMTEFGPYWPDMKAGPHAWPILTAV